MARNAAPHRDEQGIARDRGRGRGRPQGLTRSRRCAGGPPRSGPGGGVEVIVRNADLISEKGTNLTLFDQRIRVEIRSGCRPGRPRRRWRSSWWRCAGASQRAPRAAADGTVPVPRGQRATARPALLGARPKTGTRSGGPERSDRRGLPRARRRRHPDRATATGRPGDGGTSVSVHLRALSEASAAPAPNETSRCPRRA